MDIKINQLTGGWDFKGGKLNTVSGLEEIAQHIANTVQLQAGRYRPDPAKGIDWSGQILGKKPAPTLLTSALIKRAVLSVNGVSSIKDYSQSYDRRNRTLFVSFEAVTSEGNISAQAIGPDLQGATAYVRSKGIDQFIEYLRGRGLDALASIIVVKGWEAFPSFKGSKYQGISDLADAYEIADWSAFLLTLYDTRGRMLIY